MKIFENLGTLFLGIWLFLSSLLSLTGIKIPMNFIYLLGVITGIMLLVSKAKLSGSLGKVILGIWLLIQGLVPFFELKIPYIGILMSLLAICAGILILLKR